MKTARRASKKGGRTTRSFSKQQRAGGAGRPVKTRAALMRAEGTGQSDPFRHVVLLMLENRSFDHMLGALQTAMPDVDGVPAEGPARSNVDVLGQSIEQLAVAGPVVDPDPKHETPNVLNQLDDNNGRFVKDYQRAYPNVSGAQKQAVMAYHRLGSLSALHTLGRAFAVCDRWFSCVPGPTWTNRLFAMSGTSLGRVKMPEGLFHPNLHNYDQPSVFRRLEEAGRGLRIYFGDFPLALLLADRRTPAAALRFSPLDRFSSDAGGAEASFPDFSFIEPSYMSDPNDDHPPHDVVAGERLIAQVYEAIRRNDALWKSTLLVIAYDEHGGFYDHASPPSARPPDRHQEEYAFDRAGVRVPVVLVSPWIASQVIHTECDHTGLLSSLRRKWNLREMGQRVHEAPDILGSVRLTEAPREDTPERLVPELARAMPRAPKRAAVAPTLNDHQRAIVAFSAYLETQTTASAEQKMRGFVRAQRSPADAIGVAEERARRYLADLRARGGKR